MLIVLCFRCEALRLIALTEFEFQHVLHEIVHGTAAVSHDLDDLLGCPVRCSEKQMLKSPIKLLI